MGLQWRLWIGHLTMLGAAGTLLLVGGRLSAQTTSPGGGGAFSATGSTEDEIAPRLLAGPNGEIWRLWQRRADPRAGGGAVILAVASPPDKWQTLVEIRSTEKGVTIRDSELAVSPSPSNQLALIYRWWRDQPRVKQLRVARSDDAGKTWSRPDTPIDTSGKAFEPHIAWGPGRSLVAVWTDERRDARLFDVYARRSPDGGATWESEQLLSRFPELLPNDVFARPRLIADGHERLWAVWVGVKSGRSSVYMNRSLDGGRTWTDPTALTGDSRSVYGHSLYRSGDRLLLVWQDTRTERDRLYAVSSTDAGTTWTAPVRVDHVPAESAVAVNAPTALLSVDGEALVAWHDGRNGRDDIFLARSTDGGRTWGTEDRMDLDEAGTAVSQYPRLAKATDGRVALAWDDDRAGFENVYLRIRSAGGKTEWGPEVRVSAPTPKLAARLPQLLWASDGTLYVAWEVWDHRLAPGSLSKRVDSKALRVNRP